jgi:hypothetical protein
MAFNEKNASNIEKIKDAMAAAATDGNASAATAYANMLNAESLRRQAVAAEKGATPPTTWAGRAAADAAGQSVAA